MFKILITGSSGFIGQHLLHYLRVQGYTVIPADIKDGIDLTQEHVVKNLPDVDIVIHLAAYNGTMLLGIAYCPHNIC
jgi:nucleoside-diphosphate-sugar epimerase